jgi:Family of unknown function (DUF5677)
MAWDAHKGILDRDLAAINARPYVDKIRPVLVEANNYATNALVRCSIAAKGPDGEDNAVLALFHHVIEMADGIETLIGSGAAVPSVPLVRSMFEAWLGLQWILLEEARYRERALAWVVGDMRRSLADLEALDPKTGRGRALLGDIANDRFAGRVKRPPLANVRKAILARRADLAAPVLGDTVRRFDDLKTEIGREPDWYALRRGPRSQEQLARKLKLGGVYAILYRDWSNIVHALDNTRYAVRGPRDSAVIGHLRDPGELPGTGSHCMSFLLDSTRLVLAKFRDEEEAYSRWYVECIQEGFKQARSIAFPKSATVWIGPIVRGR